jgi:hypothetical protein
VAAAFSLSSALITRQGVGVIEYVVGFAVVVGLLLIAARRTRSAFQSR